MKDFVNDLLKTINPQTSEKIGSSLNIDPNIIQQAIPVLAPMILGGLKKQSETQGGQQRVDHILNKYGNPEVLDNVDGFVDERINMENADPNLGGLLGNSGTEVTNMFSEKFGLNSSTAAKIIPMVAPLILGYLTKSRNSNPQGSTGFASFLDQNGDGSIIDDVAGFFIGGNKQGNQSNDPFSNILGGLFGGKQ